MISRTPRNDGYATRECLQEHFYKPLARIQNDGIPYSKTNCHKLHDSAGGMDEYIGTMVEKVWSYSTTQFNKLAVNG